MDRSFRRTTWLDRSSIVRKRSRYQKLENFSGVEELIITRNKQDVRLNDGFIIVDVVIQK